MPFESWLYFCGNCFILLLCSCLKFQGFRVFLSSATNHSHCLWSLFALRVIKTGCCTTFKHFFRVLPGSGCFIRFFSPWWVQLQNFEFLFVVKCISGPTSCGQSHEHDLPNNLDPTQTRRPRRSSFCSASRVSLLFMFSFPMYYIIYIIYNTNKY